MTITQQHQLTAFGVMLQTYNNYAFVEVTTDQNQWNQKLLSPTLYITISCLFNTNS